MNSVGIVPVRRVDGKPQVLWSRRPDDRKWFGGFWAFPVGRIRSGDSEVPLAATSGALSVERSVYGCAAREMFEELGVLPLADGWSHRDVGGERSELGSFVGLLRDAGARVDPELLQSVGQWRTPPWFSRTFTTEFLACTLPPAVGSSVLDTIDADEHLEAAWVRPERALSGWSAGREFVSTPIRLVLEALAAGPGGKWRWVRRDGRAGEDGTELMVTDDWLAGGGEDRADIEIARGVRWMALPSQTLTATNRTNCWMVGRERIAIVDPGTPYRREIEMLCETLERLRDESAQLGPVLLTHHHHDHIGAVEALVDRLDLPVWCHAETAIRLPDRSVVDRELTDRATIELGGDRHLEAHHTPGHAAGHLAFRMVPENHVIAGDLVARGTTVLIDPDDGHMGSYLRSLRWLKEQRPASLLPGHGHPIGQPDRVIDSYLDHRERREQQIYEALCERTIGADEPATPADLVPEVYQHAPRRRWPLAMRSLEAHLLHLVEQGKVARRAGGYVVESQNR